MNSEIVCRNVRWPFISNTRLRFVFAAALGLASGSPRLFASPPLVTGDVPTADRGHFELYTGARYQDSGRIERQLPHLELVYGVSDRWEISAEGNYLSREGRRGSDDLTLATKFTLVSESAANPALGVSYEYKFANGDAVRGLGSGGVEHDLRLRAQKTFGRFTPILNIGYVAIPDAHIGGLRIARRDAWRASCAQEWQAIERFRLLTELYWRSTDEPGEPARFGWNVGFKHRLRDGLAWHGAVGESLRPGHRGGPELRAYLGVKFDLSAPWTTTARR